MTELAEAIVSSGPTWVPSEAFLSSSAFADLLQSRRQELQLLQVPAFSIRPGPASPPAATEAFARHIENLLPFLRKTARRWHCDKAHADDLVQDTIVRALANAHLWQLDQPESNLRGWLFTIMRNRFLAGKVRAKRSEAALDAIAAADECVPAGPSRPEARLMMRDVERVLARLPAPQRTAIQRIGVEGRSYEEAARLMGMTVAAVRCHLSRGRERLRALVEGQTRAMSRTLKTDQSASSRRHTSSSAPRRVVAEYA